MIEYGDLQDHIEKVLPKTPFHILAQWEKIKTILNDGQGYLTKTKPVKVVFFEDI